MAKKFEDFSVGDDITEPVDLEKINSGDYEIHADGVVKRPATVSFVKSNAVSFNPPNSVPNPVYDSANDKWIIAAAGTFTVSYPNGDVMKEGVDCSNIYSNTPISGDGTYEFVADRDPVTAGDAVSIGKYMVSTTSSSKYVGDVVVDSGVYVGSMLKMGEGHKLAAASDETDYQKSLMYNSSKTYSVGDPCIKDGVLYTCKTAITTAGEWTEAYWYKVSDFTKTTADTTAGTATLSQNNATVATVYDANHTCEAVSEHFEGYGCTIKGVSFFCTTLPDASQCAVKINGETVTWTFNANRWQTTYGGETCIVFQYTSTSPYYSYISYKSTMGPMTSTSYDVKSLPEWITTAIAKDFTKTTADTTAGTATLSQNSSTVATVYDAGHTCEANVTHFSGYACTNSGIKFSCTTLPSTSQCTVKLDDIFTPTWTYKEMYWECTYKELVCRVGMHSTGGEFNLTVVFVDSVAVQQDLVVTSYDYKGLVTWEKTEIGKMISDYTPSKIVDGMNEIYADGTVKKPGAPTRTVHSSTFVKGEGVTLRADGGSSFDPENPTFTLNYDSSMEVWTLGESGFVVDFGVIGEGGVIGMNCAKVYTTSPLTASGTSTVQFVGPKDPETLGTFDFGTISITVSNEQVSAGSVVTKVAAGGVTADDNTSGTLDVSPLFSSVDTSTDPQPTGVLTNSVLDKGIVKVLKERCKNLNPTTSSIADIINALQGNN